MKKNVLVLVIEILLILAYLYFQPQCEPCIDMNDCPLCISNTQIGIIVVGSFILLWLCVLLVKKKN